MIRKDPYTGEFFYPDRKNQIYATAQNRIDHNNDLAAKTRIEQAAFFKPMNTNYKILCSLVKPAEKKTFLNSYLDGKGFNRNLFSHLEEYDGKTCYAFFSFVIVPNEDKSVTTIYRKDDTTK